MGIRIMVLSDAGLGSLIATAIAAEEIVVVGASGKESDRVQSVSVLRARGRLSTDAAQAAAVAEQCRALGVEQLQRALPPIDDQADPSRGESATIELTMAAYTAMRAGCSRLIWPAQVDRRIGDREALDHAAEICDRALLISRLLLLDAGGMPVPEVTIHTPLVDLEDEHLAELALDLAIPLQLVWWWSAQGQRADEARERWLPALERVGWKGSTASV